MHLKHKPLAHSKHSASPTGFTVLTGCTGHTGVSGMEAGLHAAQQSVFTCSRSHWKQFCSRRWKSSDPAENRVETITHPSLLWFYLEHWKVSDADLCVMKYYVST